MPAPPPLNVLIVEDDPLTCKMLIHALRTAGFGIDIAGTVVEAKRLLTRGDYAVLILDLILPDGRGFDVLDFIRAEKLPPMKTVVITAADPALLARLDRSVVKTVMFKPVDMEHLIATVRALAANPSARRS